MEKVLAWASENPEVVVGLLAVLAALLKGGITWKLALSKAAEVVVHAAARSGNPKLFDIVDAKLGQASALQRIAEAVEAGGASNVKRAIGVDSGFEGRLVRIAIQSAAAMADPKPEKKPVHKGQIILNAILGNGLSGLLPWNR